MVHVQKQECVNMKRKLKSRKKLKPKEFNIDAIEAGIRKQGGDCFCCECLSNEITRQYHKDRKQKRTFRKESLYISR